MKQKNLCLWRTCRGNGSAFGINPETKPSVKSWWGKCFSVLRCEQFKLGFDAAVSHTHPGQRRADLLGCTWNNQQSFTLEIRQKSSETDSSIGTSTKHHVIIQNRSYSSLYVFNKSMLHVIQPEGSWACCLIQETQLKHRLSFKAVIWWNYACSFMCLIMVVNYVRMPLPFKTREAYSYSIMFQPHQQSSHDTRSLLLHVTKT